MMIHERPLFARRIPALLLLLMGLGFVLGCRSPKPADPDAARKTLQAAEEMLGLANIHVIHANDSKFPRGSHVDRHAHIGEGHIGLEAFRRILNHPKLRRKPFILETPVDQEGDDQRNLDTLKKLVTDFPPRRR